jgi:hypothetical protein
LHKCLKVFCIVADVLVLAENKTSINPAPADAELQLVAEAIGAKGVPEKKLRI